ncbi:hypothetical protein MIND_01163800 [Mycena indigotica]|uniref:Uncharacterized protein n=1 Tax=Mycena indigotica TaxID=2126181 RepID=A0A8H6S4I3_9AGAR|nr:uncharacterized protein MIND_01163800 [Mycena indigotica]KAF7292656.1 hypothetical protein MIND_01163800 [Mycena indigotica]
MSAAPTGSENPHSKNSTSIGSKVKGGAKVAQGLGNTVRGTTFAAIDSVENRDSSTNDGIARRGRREIEEGIAMIKGHSVKPTATGPGNSLQGWGTGINGANSEATTSSYGFPPPRGAAYAQNSTGTTANTEPSDLGLGSNAYSGHPTGQPPSYPTPGAQYAADKVNGGLGYTHPTQLGNRPNTGDMVGEAAYEQRQDADQM